MISARPCTPRSGLRGSATHAAKRPATSTRCSTSRSIYNPPSEERWPLLKRAITGSPPISDKSGSAGVGSTLVGMVLQIGRIGVSNHVLRWIKGL